MDHNNILKNLFEYTNGFDINLYKDFLGELCKTYDREQRLLPIEKNEESVIVQKTKIGRYTDNQWKHIDFLIIKLANWWSIQKARHLQRNVISSYLKNYGVYNWVDHVIAVFYADGYADWRLSFVKQQFKLGVDAKTGKPKVDNEFTPAKRFSFFIEKGSKNQTIRKQSLELIKASIKPNINEIEKIFSVEKVTKEFFDQYKSLYQRLLIEFNEDLAFQSVIERYSNGDIHFAENFVKKLLGQIVFLYFIQKKWRLWVWEGQKRWTGEQAFLRKIYTHCVNKNKLFFDDYLEPLFYKTLSKQRLNDRSEELNCKIPYLNGGLFEPLHNYNREWDQNMIRVWNSIFGEILDTFDTFNFTIYENDPLEQDVAVDPEMLGKIFENLLPDNERKGKGAFYTPREIVHYMCKQSLIQYLVTKTEIPEERIAKLIERKDSMDNLKKLDEFDVSDEAKKQLRIEAMAIDNALRDVKIVDPAVWSGAFPMGILKEIVDIRRYIRWNILQDQMIPKNELLYTLKKETLSHCIYGVDLDPGAVDIAKLRFWLSLVVDYEWDHIEPLPNLDYKIMQGNSLIENPIIGDQVIDLGLWDSNIKIKKTEKDNVMKDWLFERESSVLLKRLTLLHADYFKENTPDHKKILKQDIHDLENRIIIQKAKETIDNLESEISNNYRGEITDKKSQELANKHHTIKQINDMIDHLTETGVKNYFPWRLHFWEIFRDHGGFDIVIGNPPYVGEKGNKEIFQQIAKWSMKEFYIWKMDLFYFFFHLTLNLWNNNAQIAFITTNYFPTADGALKLRRDFKERAIIRKLINLNELKIFESALWQHNMITILSKGNDQDFMAETYITQRKWYYMNINSWKGLEDIFNKNDIETEYFNIPQDDLYDTSNNYIRLNRNSRNQKNDIDVLISKVDGIQLWKICNVNQWIVSWSDSVFVLSNKQNIELWLEWKSFIKKFYKNSDVFKYTTSEKSLLNIIYTTDIEYIEKDIEINNYLGLKRNITSKYSWRRFDLHRPREKKIFEWQKIVAPQRSKENTFGYNEISWYAASDVFFITSKDEYNYFNLKYILAIINSKLYYTRLYHKWKRKWEYLELTAKPLSEIPIKEISEDNQKPFIELVDQILATKNDDHKADTSVLEKEIDQLVYQLYELTDEEIAIVEESVK